MGIKVTVPQGTRDFGPEVVKKRNYILTVIREVFECYGFQPLETPAMENLDTLAGKYGEEGDKLIFKILNNGLAQPEKRQQALEGFEKILEGKNVKEITERALRYDLTIPFARYVAMHHRQLPMPFKRYQIQPVWRADKPQKGRYREFCQCDADIVGSVSPWCEVDLINIYKDVFTRLNINAEIRLNSRKILTALAVAIGSPEKFNDITVAIDKLDKVGMDKVQRELFEKGLTFKQVILLEDYLTYKGSVTEKLNRINGLLGTVSEGREGIQDLEFLFEKAALSENSSIVAFDQTLARGLNYYTGVIFEVKARDVRIGSIGGGGRYDNLTGLFGVPGIPGVGISFGVDRIYDVMEETEAFPEAVTGGTQVLFLNMGQQESEKAYPLMQSLRHNKIPAELYHEKAKLDKQFRYAEKRGIPFAVIIGEKEWQENNCNIKNLQTGVQQTISLNELLTYPFLPAGS